VLGALDLPAVPINVNLESEMLPGAEKTKQRIGLLLNIENIL
jgi:2-oxoisovalerate dehydrogenase E1 component